LEGKEEEYQRVLDVNLHSAYRMSLHFIKRLKSSERTGNILNIGSIEAIMPLKEGLVDYAISKAGVAALTRSLARDFGKDNIRVNAILPGGIKTRGTTEIAKDIRNLNLGLLKTGYNFNQRLPLGRMGQPDDIARMALVMVSELSSFMTGAIIPVDGGFLSS
jgi:3-oxoacyl-[acyl-carrier protein] reductase